MSNDPEHVGEIIQPIVNGIDATDRAEVVRTRHTEERAPIDEYTRAYVLRRCHYRCEWCGSRNRLELDHIVPWSAGGSDDASNLRALCHDCNDRRSNWTNPVDVEIASRNANVSSGFCMKHYASDPAMQAAALPDRQRVFCPFCGSVVLGISLMDL